jgi:hypothetical protein
MKRDADVTGRTLMLLTSLILMYCVVIMLIVVSMIEVADILEASIRDLQKHRNILLAFALTTALVPSASMLFWVGKAITQR